MKIHSDISENLLVKILETTSPELSQIDLTEGIWTSHLLGFDLDKNSIEKRVANKQSESVTLEVNGERSYVLVYIINSENFLYVQNLVALKPTANFRSIMNWIRTSFCVDKKVKGVLFDTKSAAVYRLGRSLGFKSMGVILFQET